MLKNIQFSLEEIGKHKLIFLFRVLQIAVSLLLLSYIFQVFYSFQEMHQKIQILTQDGEVFVLRDENDDERYEKLTNQSQYTEDFHALIQTIQNSSVEYVVLNNNYETSIAEKVAPLIQVSANFFEKYNLSGTYTETFIKENFQTQTMDEEQWQNKTKKAVMGDSYREQYEIGDIIESDWGEKFEVLGFFDKGEGYVLPMQGKEIYSLDNAIVVPVNIDKQNNGNMMEYIFSCQFITQNRDSLIKIEQVNREKGLLDTYFQSYTTQLQYIENDVIECIVLFGSFGVILFLFSFIGIICMIMQMIVEQEYEYAINLLCGAKISDIYTRVLLQVAYLIGSGILAVILVFGWKKAVVPILMIGIGCFLIAFFYSIKRIKFDVLTSSLRSKE